MSKRDYLADLGFELEERADVWVVVDDCGGVTPASLTERVLWGELSRLDRGNAELVEQNEDQKNEWLSWDAKRAALEREAARYRLIRRGQRWSVIDGIGNTLRGGDLDAAVDAALTSATKETP